VGFGNWIVEEEKEGWGIFIDRRRRPVGASLKFLALLLEGRGSEFVAFDLRSMDGEDLVSGEARGS
jgi:hypothetical protein